MGFLLPDILTFNMLNVAKIGESFEKHIYYTFTCVQNQIPSGIYYQEMD